MKDAVREAVRGFYKKYKVHNPSKDDIENAIEEAGYTIVKFNSIDNDDSVRVIIHELNLVKYTNISKGFTYADDKYRIVFVNEDLSHDEMRIVLTHELGHILLGHFSHSNIIGQDVIDEFEANEFVHYVLCMGTGEKLAVWMKLHKARMAIILFFCIVAVVSVLAVVHIKSERKYYGNYYVTDSGKKYHEAGCIYVKNKDNIHRLTIEEFESGEYEPCKKCLP